MSSQSYVVFTKRIYVSILGITVLYCCRLKLVNIFELYAWHVVYFKITLDTHTEIDIHFEKDDINICVEVFVH